MPPELTSNIANWGPIALILFGILYRADQYTKKLLDDLLPVVIEHFKKLASTMDKMQSGIDTLAALNKRVDEVGSGLAEDHEAIAEDAKHARIQATAANDGIKELLIRIPQRIGDREHI